MLITNYIKAGIIFCLLAGTFPLKAQYKKDAQLWSNVQISQNLPGPFSYNIQYQHRLDQNFTRSKGHYNFLNLNYKLNKRYSTCIEYRYVISPGSHSHRFSSETNGKYKWGKWTLNERIVFQIEYPWLKGDFKTDNLPKWVFRNRLQLRYNLYKKVQLQVSAEPFINLDDNLNINRLRSVTGVNYELSKNIELLATWLFQTELGSYPRDVISVIFVQLSYSLPDIKKKKGKEEKVKKVNEPVQP